MCIEISTGREVQSVNVPQEVLDSVRPGHQLWVQSGSAVMIPHATRDQGESRHYLTNYDFTEGTGEYPTWTPGGS